MLIHVGLAPATAGVHAAPTETQRLVTGQQTWSWGCRC